MIRSTYWSKESAAPPALGHSGIVPQPFRVGLTFGDRPSGPSFEEAIVSSVNPLRRNVVGGFKTATANLVDFHKSSGKHLGEVALPQNAAAAPMRYMHQGRRFNLVATGGANTRAAGRR